MSIIDFAPFEFTSVIESDEINLGWWVAVLPFDSLKKFGTKKNFNVSVHLGGKSFPSTLFPTGTGKHYLMVTNAMKDTGLVFLGEECTFEIENDPFPRLVPVPEPVQDALDQHPLLLAVFEKLSPSHRRYFVQAWEKAKAPETKLKRIAFMLEKLEEYRKEKASKQ